MSIILINIIIMSRVWGIWFGEHTVNGGSLTRGQNLVMHFTIEAGGKSPEQEKKDSNKQECELSRKH